MLAKWDVTDGITLYFNVETKQSRASLLPHVVHVFYFHCSVSVYKMKQKERIEIISESE